MVIQGGIPSKFIKCSNGLRAECGYLIFIIAPLDPDNYRDCNCCAKFVTSHLIYLSDIH
jgi:hypothetical protein